MDGCRRIDSDNQTICGAPIYGILGLCESHKGNTCKWTEDGDDCNEPRKESKESHRHHIGSIPS